MLSHGGNEWTKYVYVPSQARGEIRGATYQYDEGSFYYCGSNNWTVTFSMKDKEWTPYRLVSSTIEGIEPLAFSYARNYYMECEIKKWVEEEVGVPVSTCGTVVPRKHWDMLIHNESIIERSSSNNDASKGSNLKGIWIQPRFFEIPQNQSWSL